MKVRPGRVPPPIFLQEYHSRRFIFDLAQEYHSRWFIFAPHKSIILQALTSAITPGWRSSTLITVKNFLTTLLSVASSRTRIALERRSLLTQATCAGDTARPRAKVNIYFTARVKRGSFTPVCRRGEILRRDVRSAQGALRSRLSLRTSILAGCSFHRTSKAGSFSRAPESALAPGGG